MQIRKDTREMAVRDDIRRQLQKIDEQIIGLLAERYGLCQDALEEDSDAFDAAALTEMVSDWENSADEQGLHMPTMSKLCRLCNQLCLMSGE